MTARRWAECVGGLMLISGLLVGCGQKGGGSGANAFDNAAPEIKETWSRAQAADKANDYVTAVVGYQEIQRQQDTLEPEQITAAEEAAGKLFQRVVDASTQGDAAARQALKTLGAMDRGQAGP